MSKKQSTPVTRITFLGYDSFDRIKKNKSIGLFWTLKDGQVFFKDTSTHKESSFDSYADFVKFCDEKFKSYIITT